MPKLYAKNFFFINIKERVFIIKYRLKISVIIDSKIVPIF